MTIDLTDTNAARSSQRCCRHGGEAGSPGVGMVLTLVVVTDEVDARRRDPGGAARRRREHPSRILVRRSAAPARGGRGWTPRSGSAATRRGRGRPAAALRRSWPSTASVVRAAAAARRPGRRLVARRRARGPGARPARRAGAAPDHRRRRGVAEAARGAGAAGRATTPRATPTWPGPGSPRGAALLAAALDQPPEPVSRRGRSRPSGQPERRPAGRLAGAAGCTCPSTRSAPARARASRRCGCTSAHGDIELTAPGRRGWRRSAIPAQPERPVALQRRDDRRAARRGAAPARPRRHLRSDGALDGEPAAPLARPRAARRGRAGRPPPTRRRHETGTKKPAPRPARETGTRRPRAGAPEASARPTWWSTARDAARGGRGGPAGHQAGRRAGARRVAARRAHRRRRSARRRCTGRARTRRPRDAVDWRRVDVWWGDERFLPAGDPERNETQAREALLDARAARPGPGARDGGQRRAVRRRRRRRGGALRRRAGRARRGPRTTATCRRSTS